MSELIHNTTSRNW